MSSILATYKRFAFAILPCPMIAARDVIMSQADIWGRPLVVDRPAQRDVRQILSSLDGPTQLPSVSTGILLSEIDGPSGLRTLFVSNVADGFSSMIYMISRRISDYSLSVQISDPLCDYPRNALTAVVVEKAIRTVYAMRDINAWEFFQKGDPLFFEEPSLYDARLKRDRLTPNIISGYLARLGYGSLDQDFWISTAPAHLLCDQNFRLWSEAR